MLDVGLDLRARAYRPWGRKIADPIVGRTHCRSHARYFRRIRVVRPFDGNKAALVMFGASPACFCPGPKCAAPRSSPHSWNCRNRSARRRSWRRPRKRPRTRIAPPSLDRDGRLFSLPQAAFVSPAPGPLLRRGAFCCRLCVDAGTEPRTKRARIYRRTSRPSGAVAIRLRPAYTLSPQDGPAPGAVVGHSAGISEREPGWTPGRCGKTAIVATIAATSIAVAV
jgi:hypothetical protein